MTTISIQKAAPETQATAASDPDEGYLAWGAGLVPPVFVRPIFIRTRAARLS